VKLTVNGSMHEFDADVTVTQLIMSITGTTRGSAVVVDGEVVPRSEWDAQQLADGQLVELITAVQGG